MSNRTMKNVNSNIPVTLLERGDRYMRYTTGPLSDALEIAISDMEKVEKLKTTTIDMSYYAMPPLPSNYSDPDPDFDNEPCRVCLAGAALFQTCNLRSVRAIDNSVGRREAQISYIACGSGLWGFTRTDAIFGNPEQTREEQIRCKKTMKIIDTVRKERFPKGWPEYGVDGYKDYLWAVVKGLREANL